MFSCNDFEWRRPIYNKWVNMWALCDFITCPKIIHYITYTICSKCMGEMESKWNDLRIFQSPESDENLLQSCFKLNMLWMNGKLFDLQNAWKIWFWAKLIIHASCSNAIVTTICKFSRMEVYRKLNHHCILSPHRSHILALSAFENLDFLLIQKGCVNIFSTFVALIIWKQWTHNSLR